MHALMKVFYSTFSQHFFICGPLYSTVTEDRGIEPRTVATLALEVRLSNHSTKSHPPSARSHPPSAGSHPLIEESY
jgi:hypothetical protein